MQDTKIIATCYLYAESNNDELCICTNANIQIKSKSKHIIAPLTDIKSIKIIKKKLLFPIIVGGVVAPLTLLAILFNLFNPEILQAILVLAGISFYYGYFGKDAIQIEYRAASEILLLKKRMSHLAQFVEYINGCLMTSFNIDYASLYLSADSEDQRHIAGNHNLPEKPRHLVTFQELKRNNPFKGTVPTYSVNPILLQQPVQFRYADGKPVIEYSGIILLSTLRPC